jgi:ABC-type lipoprotein release transport system permease subunit
MVAGRFLASVLVDLAPFDAVTFMAVPAGFIAAALLAAWLPARRATRINPLLALRSE